MVPCANDKLNIDPSDELKINVDNLDELLRTVNESNLAALQRVRFIYNFDDDVPDELELGTAHFLGALPQLQMLQLDGWTGTEKLLQRAITEASGTPFTALKTVSWGSGTSPLNELLPLWRFPVEHIEVSLSEPDNPVAGSRERWPAPTRSLLRLNLNRSSITIRTVKKLLRLSPCLEFFRYDHYSDVTSEWSS
jgi:hypothetical protein